MAKEKIIGIDLGTTFSAVAVLEGGKPVIIPNAEGSRITPSVVAITKDGERLVGQMARNQAVSNPEHTVRSIKRHMGEDYKVKIWDKEYSPQEISAMVLQKLKADAESYLGTKVKKAVITVPAYFQDAQRQATKDAGTIAGLEVLRIINEPTSASLAYGLDKSHEHTIMVFDFGGGTFDVSVLELSDGVFEVKATNGNNYLGGDDIDDKLSDWIATEFKKEQGIDLREDKTAAQRLREAAEKAKIELSTKLSTDINLPFITAKNGQPLHLTKNLSRAKFEQLIADILEKLKGPTKQALKDAKVDTVDKVVLVGGSTRIPIVQKIVKDITGKEGDKSVNPDEAVALGAAIQAGVLGGEVKDILLLDVTPLSLGIETLGGVFTKIIERNTTIPTKKSQIFSTATDNQPAVSIRVAQGERAMFNDNKILGQFDLVGIPPAPRGIPQVEVTFDIDANGIINVQAKDLGTKKEQKITLTASTNLTKEEIEKMAKDAEKFAEEDHKKRDEIETINHADQVVYQSTTLFEEMAGKVDSAKMDEAKKEVEKLKGLLESQDKDSSAIKKQLEHVNKLVQALSVEMYQKAGAEYQKEHPEAEGEEHEHHAHGKKGHKHGDEKSDDNVVDAEYTEETEEKTKKHKK